MFEVASDRICRCTLLYSIFAVNITILNGPVMPKSADLSTTTILPQGMYLGGN